MNSRFRNCYQASMVSFVTSSEKLIHTVNQQRHQNFVFKTEIMRSHPYESDDHWKAPHAHKSRPYPAAHHPHSVLGTVGNTGDTSGDARAVQDGRGKVITALTQPFRFLEIALYGCLQCQLLLVISRLLWQTRPIK